jgi:hypothetical protein
MHSNVPNYTIWSSGPCVLWGNLVTLFWILAFAGSRKLQVLVIVSCSAHPRTSFQICNTKGLILERHHATSVKKSSLISKSRDNQPSLQNLSRNMQRRSCLAKASPGQRFRVPYLHTFSIAGSRIDGLKIVFQIFRELQTAPRVPQYTICPQECIKTLNSPLFPPPPLYYPFVVLYLVTTI